MIIKVFIYANLIMRVILRRSLFTKFNKVPEKKTSDLYENW